MMLTITLFLGDLVNSVNYGLLINKLIIEEIIIRKNINK